MPLSHIIHWAFDATYAASSEASEWAEGWARKARLPEALILRLVLVIEELFTNTIKHGYCGESNRQVLISLAARDGLALLDYRDQAPPFDPIGTVAPGPALTPPTEVGGMGLRLIQSLGQESVYVHENGWNSIHLVVGPSTTPGQTANLGRRKGH